VPDLAGAPVAAGQRRSVHDHPGSDTGAADEVDDVVAAPGVAAAELGKHREVRVVADRDRRPGSEPVVQEHADVGVAPSEVRGDAHGAGALVDRAGDAHPDAEHRTADRARQVRDRCGDQVGHLLRGGRACTDRHRPAGEHFAADAHGRSGQVRDVHVHGHHRRSGRVRAHDVRRTPDPVAADGHRLLQQPELCEVGDQRADRRPADSEPLGELGPGQAAVAVHVAQDQRQVVPADGVGPRRG
jgi:hypothetical protein